jgi:hypothetical protein
MIMRGNVRNQILACAVLAALFTGILFAQNEAAASGLQDKGAQDSSVSKITEMLNRNGGPESLSQGNQSLQQKGSINEWLADQVIAGEVTEEQFLEANLTPNQAVKVFRHIARKRGWKLTDGQVEEIVAQGLSGQKQGDGNDTMTLARTCHYGGCSQDIIQSRPPSKVSKSYPYTFTSPNGIECGDDNDDIVFVFNTPKGSKADPKKIRYWHDNWYVRWVLGFVYSCGLGANGICTQTTRMCMGSFPYNFQLSLKDFFGIYLWHK